jgi:hypothetical protein
MYNSGNMHASNPFFLNTRVCWQYWLYAISKKLRDCGQERQEYENSESTCKL